jgi:hypothetical protein
MGMRKAERSKEGRSMAGLWLFILLTAVYLLSYSGQFHAIDEVSVVAMTESLVKRAQVSTDQIRWSQGWTPSQGRVGPDGHLYSKKGIGSAILGSPFYWLALRVPQAGAVRAMMLSNALVTALTGYLLYASVRLLGYRSSVAFLTALAYGLATMAWPYAKYFFSEPLIALGLVGGLWGLLLYRRTHTLLYVSLAGLGLGAALLAKVANIVVWPFFLAYGFWSAGTQHVERPKQGRTAVDRIKGVLPFTIALVAPMAVAGLALAAYNLVRVGHPLDLGYAPDETFSTPLGLGLAGLLVSPGKGLFLYSPILLAALLGIPALFRRDRSTALLGLSVALAYPLLYAGWFMWWGGWSWGPRFFVPAIPFICLFLAPVVDWVLNPGRWWAKVLLALLGLLSVGVQVLGVAVDFNQYLMLLYQRGLDSGQINFQVELSPILGHWALLRSAVGAEGGAGLLDLAWADPAAEGIDLPRLLWPLALFAGAALGWLGHRRAAAGQGRVARAGAWLWAAVCAAILLVSMDALARQPASADEWQAGGTELSATLQDLAHRDDLMIVDLLPFGDHFSHTTSLLDRYKAAPAYWGWAREEPVSPGRKAQLEALGKQYGRVWLVLDTTPEADPASTTERWLDENAFRVANRWLSPAMRFVFYAWPGESSDQIQRPSPHVRFGGNLWLDGYGPFCTVRSDGIGDGACQDPGAVVALPGDILTFSMLWRAAAAEDQDYTVFIQLLDEGGSLRGQIDRSPMGGFRPTSTWQPGEVIRDNYGFELPSDLAPGHYQLIGGIYLPANGERLSLTSADGLQLGDHARLAEVVVVEGDGQ